MASLTTDPDGRRRILFKDTDGKRKAIRLGKIPKQRALSVKLKIEDLVSAKITGHPPEDETSRWLTSLDEKVASRLATLGLTNKRPSSTLAQFVDDYITKRSDVKKCTADNYRHTRRNLVDHFGANKPLRNITAGDAIDFRNALLTGGLEDSTTRKRCSIASQIFLYALKHKVITENPFSSVPKNVRGSKHRAYVSESDAKEVLEQLPNTEWKLLFSLSRWGGLRVGSEVRLLRWCDIDWENNRFLVHSPKTAHHEGRATRMVPIFPELATLLSDRQLQAEDGEELVLPMLTGRTDSAMREILLRAVKSSGVTQWSRLWHSMRSSRQTDLEREFPTHVVCNWIGNSEETAREHYLQVTDVDFKKAVGEKATQKATQHPPKHLSTAPHGENANEEKPGKHYYTSVSRASNVVREGLEPPTKEL